VSGDAGLPDGFVLCALDSVASTNDEAKRRAEDGAEEGLVITAREQVQGRGRYGRSWASPPGNLYASVLLRPDCPMAASAQLSLVAGLALADALERLGPRGLHVRLKWPNDVLIGGAKVAGLLLEGAARPDGRAAWVIVGSGVNVASCPDGTPYPATCLGQEGFVELAPLAVLRPYLFALAEWLERWRSSGFEPVRKAWLERCMGLGSEIRLRLDREEISGRFVDLSDTGALLLELAGGRRRTIAAGDVFYLDG
jgi:BirA family transcriptional regulator, biotin operon repressor / biotin---[acetyl-CoA-carboxylase] ligase